MTRLTAKETSWLATNQPGLIHFERPTCTITEGKFRFNLVHEDNPLDDSYDIRLELPYDSKLRPRLRETAGRLQAVYESRQLSSPADMHIYENWNLCYAAPQEITLLYLPQPDIALFFEKYVGPYFYAQSFFEKYGKWPWDHLRHGAKGLIDWFILNYTLPGAVRETAVEIHKLAKKQHADAVEIISRSRRYDSFNPRSKCLCGSKYPYLGCHPTLSKLALALRQYAN